MSTKNKGAKKTTKRANKKYTIEALSEKDLFILNTTTDETIAKYPDLSVKEVNQRRAYLRMKLKVNAAESPARWLNGTTAFPENWNPEADNSNNNSSSAAQATKTEEDSSVTKVATKATTLSGNNLVINYFGTELFVTGEVTLNHVNKISIDGNKVTVE